MVFKSKKVEEWDKGLTTEEKLWIVIAVVFALMMAVTTLVWPIINPTHEVPTTTLTIDSKAFENLALNFSAKYDGKPVPAGQTIYILARQYYWSISKLVLYKGIEYEIMVSSFDVVHGFEIVGNDVVFNLMVIPGIVYVFHISFNQRGVYYLICNEYCGYGHSYMRALIEVI
jgi:Heme/copper-type cytochrome/quinol oxidases, subunit 2